MGYEIYSLAFDGDIEGLRKKFEADPQAFCQSMNLVEGSHNALGFGILKSNVAVVEFILSKKPDIYAKLGLDQNVLHQAVTTVRYGINPQKYPDFKVDFENSIKIFELILKHEKECYPGHVDLLLDMKNQFGKTPMYDISKLESPKTITRLEKTIEKYHPGYVEQFKKRREEAKRKPSFTYVKSPSLQQTKAPSNTELLGPSVLDSIFGFWKRIKNINAGYQIIGDESEASLSSEEPLSDQKVKTE